MKKDGRATPIKKQTKRLKSPKKRSKIFLSSVSLFGAVGTRSGVWAFGLFSPRIMAQSDMKVPHITSHGLIGCQSRSWGQDVTVGLPGADLGARPNSREKKKPPLLKFTLPPMILGDKEAASFQGNGFGL